MINGAADTLAALKVRIPSVRVPVGVLSGGQRQGVAIARAVQQDSRIILLDEPTAALGYRETQQVITIIRQLREAGKAIVLVSHDLEMVFDVADEIQVMRLGRVQGVRRREDADRREIVGLITGAIEADRSREPVASGGARERGIARPASAAGAGDRARRSSARRPMPARLIHRVVISPQFAIVVVIARLRHLRRDAVGPVPASRHLDQHPPERRLHRHRRVVHHLRLRQRRARSLRRQPLPGRRHGERRPARRRLADAACGAWPASAPARFAGLVNGVLINYASIPAFITTLGMLYAARSLVVYLTGGQPIAPLPDEFTAIARADMLGLPLLLFYAAAIVIVAQIVLQTTVFGGNVRAIGGNREAASNAGINVRGISTTVYTLSGLSAAFAGVLMSARLGSGQPSIGVGFELQVISAVIIGGTSLFGGIGSVFGSLLGSLVLSILTTGLILLHIDPVLQDFVIGVIIVVAVGIDQVRRRRMFRSVGTR